MAGLRATWQDAAAAVIAGLIALDLAITGRLVIALLHRITH